MLDSSLLFPLFVGASIPVSLFFLALFFSMCGLADDDVNDDFDGTSSEESLDDDFDGTSSEESFSEDFEDDSLEEGALGSDLDRGGKDTPSRESSSSSSSISEIVSTSPGSSNSFQEETKNILERLRLNCDNVLDDFDLESKDRSDISSLINNIISSRSFGKVIETKISDPNEITKVILGASVDAFSDEERAYIERKVKGLNVLKRVLLPGMSQDLFTPTLEEKEEISLLEKKNQ